MVVAHKVFELGREPGLAQPEVAGSGTRKQDRHCSPMVDKRSDSIQAHLKAEVEDVRWDGLELGGTRMADRVVVDHKLVLLIRVSTGK